MDGARSGLLLADVVASTRLARRAGYQWPRLYARVHTLLQERSARWSGTLIGETGDGSAFAFGSANDAIRAAVDAQRAFRDEAWPDDLAVEVRIGVHRGAVEPAAGGYVGLAIHELARVTALAAGGQVIVSEHAASEAAQLPAELGLVSLGRHRVRDFDEEIELYRVEAPGLAPPAGVVRPDAGASLLGREEALRELRGLLTSERLVTIIGPGGSGKTRLADALAEQWPGEVTTVGLASVGRSADVSAAAADAVGAPAGPDPTRALVEQVGHRQMLVVVDNCEHVLDGVASLSDALLRQCPRVRIVATSREPLRTRAERAWPIPLLDRDAAVALFVRQVHAVGATVTPEDTALIGRICDQLDRLPLAIQLAAARTRALSLGDVELRLGDQMAFLVGGPRDAPDRQRTMRTAIGWTVDTLTSGERRLLARLSVFVGGMPLQGAEVVGDATDASDALEELVARSLVEFSEDRERGPRYRLLEPIRQYAAGLVDPAELTELRDAHADWCYERVRALQRAYFDDQHTTTALLDAEAGNIRTAVRHLLATGRVPTAMRLVGRLSFHWFTQTSREGLQLVEEVLAHDTGLEPPRERSDVLFAAGQLLQQAGELERSRALLEEAVAVLRPIDSGPRLAWAIYFASRSRALLGDYDRTMSEEALALFERSGDRLGIAWSTLVLAANDTDPARRAELTDVVVRLGREGPVPHVLGAALSELAAPQAIVRGDRDAAFAYFDEALESYRRQGDFWQQVGVLAHAAQTALDLRDDRVLQYLHPLVHLARDSGDALQRRWVVAMVASWADRSRMPEDVVLRLAAAGSGSAHYSVLDPTQIEGLEPALVERLEAAQVEPVDVDDALAEGLRLLDEAVAGLDG